MRKLMLFALPFGAGCLLCQYLLPDGGRLWAALAALAAALTLPSLAPREGRRAVRVVAVGLAAGIVWFAGYAALTLDRAERLVGTEDWVSMELTGYPEETGYGARCQVRLPGTAGRAVYYGGRELLGLEPGDRIGDTVTFYSAALLSGEESAYFTSQGIFLRLYGQEELEISPGGAGGVRYLPARMARALRAAAGALYDQPVRGFLIALLTGDRAELDGRSERELSEAGLMHLTAVSGLHCGFLVALLGVFTLRRQRLTALAGYPVLLAYMLMAGCTPSVVRACVMAGLALLAPLLGREGDGPTSLSAAGLVILLVNPFAVGSVSFQLSFASVAGLLTLSPRVYAALSRPPVRGARRFFHASLAASAGVTVFTAPLSAVYFGSLSLVSPVANLMTLWMAPVLFALALLGTILYILLPAAAPLAAVAGALARYVLWAAGLLARIPGHSVRFNSPAAVMWLLLAYAMLGVCLLGGGGRRRYALAALLLAACLGAARALPRMVVKDDMLTVVAVDVGQGAATLLHAGGRTALVDCGSLGNPGAAGDAAAAAMETYGWSRLDWVALTHCHTDHAGGLEALLSQVEVDRLLLPRVDGESDQAPLAAEALALAAEHGTEAVLIEEPFSTALGEAVLTVYPPVGAGGTNEEGLTVLCSAGDFDLLITGDMDGKTEAALTQTYALPDIEVLLAGHHGSKHASSQALLEAAAPEVGIISVGPNSFGHPTAEAMGRMAAAGMDLYRTDRQGNILIRVLDGEQTGGSDGGKESYQ